MTQTVIGVFDTIAEAEQAAQHLAMDVGGVRGEVYDARRHSELSTMNLPSEDSAAMEEAIRRGGAIVQATIPDEKYDAVVRVMERDGAVNLDDRITSWRQEGWTGSTTGTTAATTSETLRASGVTTGQTTGLTGATAQSSQMETGRTDSIPIVEERVNIGKRQTGHGRVRVRSYVVETPVQEQVTLHQERVQVERRPVDRPIAAGDDAFRERTVEATETTEEAVVAKEARVKEEVVVRKEAEERTETVRDTVRRTEVEVEDERASAAHNPTQSTTPRRNDPV